MKTIQSQDQRDEIRGVVERMVQDLETSRLCGGKLSVVRVLPPPGAATNTPGGYPHLMVQEEGRKRFLGLIPYNKKEVILIVKEGFYDMEDKGRKNMFVLLRSKSCEAIVKKHLEEYGKKNQVTEIVYRT
jgi:hypothetical protein